MGRILILDGLPLPRRKGSERDENIVANGERPSRVAVV